MTIATPEEALRLATSDNSHDRLMAARFFLLNVQKEHKANLELWLSRETVGWVKRALEIAISRLNEKIEVEPENIEPEENANVYSVAIKDVASMLLHELEPRIGLLGVKISNEVPDYQNSGSKREFDNLKKFFAALSRLRLATELSQIETFDCADLINEVLGEIQYQEVQIRCTGPAPSVVKADRSLLKMAVVNGIRNAIESVNSAAEQRQTDGIAITWGETNADYWIAIIDDGVGLGKMTDKPIKIGHTTKSGHFGMGLSITQQAIQTLGGKLTISPSTPRGAVFELRWYK
jgi:signal transduction histidine kinase